MSPFLRGKSTLAPNLPLLQRLPVFRFPLPEEMLLDAGLPCDPELLDMYLEDGRIVIEILEDFEEELLEEAWDEAQEDDVLSQLPAGLLDMFRCMKIDPDVVRDAIVGGGVQI